MNSPFKTFTKWSWSQLSSYRACPYQARLRYLDRSPEPPKAPDDPRDRGIRVHEAAQVFVEQDGPLIKELASFESPLTDLREARRTGAASVMMEKRIYLDSHWRVTDESNRWLVFIADAHVTGPINLTVDFKTGRKYGNEVKHYQQMELYGIGAWILDPNYDEYEAELWYLDQKDTTSIVFRPEQLEKARAKLDTEVNAMMNDKMHPPRPNKMTCRWCPFSSKGTAVCPVSAV